MGKPLHLIIILQLSFAFAYRYDPWYRADTQRPVDVITDVVNELGVRILQQYLTHGNVAFSPTGVAFVLAALYEGSAGRGSQQICEALGLPANRDVTRIGFRDIHRRLRSYLNADGFLGGLTLSKENTRLRPEYEDILRFYGFDLSSIEQEANVTVSVEDSGITELPTSTIGLTTLLAGMINTENVPDMTTTMLTGAITTLRPADAETTVVLSTAADITQQTVTTAPTDATDAQLTLTSVTSVETIVQNTSMQSANSLQTTVTSDENVQSTPSVGTETVANSPSIVENIDNQMIPTTTTIVAVEGNQNSQTSSTIVDTGTSTGTSIPIESVQISTGASMETVAVTGMKIPMSTDVQVSSTFATNTEMPTITNMSSSDSTIAMGASTDALAAESTIIATTDIGKIVPMSTDVQVPSTFATNSVMPTNMPSSDLTTITADASTDALAAESTIIASTDTNRIVQMSTDIQVPSTFATNTEVPTTNVPSSDSATITAGSSTDALAAGSTIIVTTDTNRIVPMSTDVQVPSTFATNIEVPTTNVPSSDLATITAGASTDALAVESIIISTTDTGRIVPMSTDVQVPSTFAMNTEVPTTNVASSDSSATIVADVNTDILAAESTVVNVTPTDTSAPNATLNTVTMNSLTTVEPEIFDSTNVTISSPVTETTTVNGVISQSSTEMSADISPGTTPGMTAANDLVTTMINIDSVVTVNSAITVTSPVQETNVTSSTLAENNTIANSTMSSMDNQTSLVDETVMSIRKKKDLIDIISSNIVKDGSTDGSPNFHKRKARSPRGYFSSYPDEGIWMQDLEIWKSYNTVNPGESSVGDSSAEMAFLVNGCEVSSVSASRYIAVLPFAYFPSLQAVALEFPLDDPRYNIILFMPTDKTDTHRLARDLSGKSLRLLRKRLQPTWVRATIPSFMLRGFVTLTSFLQRLGILDVFEPRVADLSPMTSDLGVYARDVQQSIGVNIRNYMKPDRTHSRESSNVVPPRRDYYRYLPPGNGLFERAGPESFTALHPFLYFIVDTETSVSLIAGRVDDPLNSRIL